MKDELNHYNINNPDGAGKTVRNEGKQSYANDSPRFIKEDSSKGQSEWENSVSENFASKNKGANNTSASAENGDVSSSASSASSSASSSVSSAASSASATSSVAASVGSSVGAVAGSVVASVVAAVVVVAAFVSTLVINLSLVMATMFSLVFQVEFIGAQEEDFTTPIFAIIEDDSGVLQQLEILPSSVYITFEGLEPNKEYIVTVKNEEKVFFKKSYLTLSEQTEQSTIETYSEGDEVTITVDVPTLNAGEFYTVTAIDADGKVVFKKDGVDSTAEYRFNVSESQTLYFSLSVNGSVQAMSQAEVVIASESAVCIHDYGELIEEEPTGCENDGTKAHYKCSACDKLFDEDKNETTLEGLIIPALGHDYGDLIEEPAGCENDGTKAHYKCSACDKLFDADKNETTLEGLIIPALGHNYGELVSEVPADCVTTGVAAYYECSVCHKVFDENKAETTLGALVIPATGHTYGELIERNYNDNGLAEHYECSVCHKLFDENKVETTAEALAISTESIGAVLLNDGAICIDPNGYARSEDELSSNPTPFVSSVTNPYLIKDQEVYWCDNIIQVYQSNSSLAVSDIYIKLSNVRIEAGSWCSLFLIKATQTVNIHLIIERTVTFVGGSGQQIFSSQGSGAPTVNIIIDQTSAGGTFNAEISDGLTYAASGTINVRYQ